MGGSGRKSISLIIVVGGSDRKSVSLIIGVGGSGRKSDLSRGRDAK